LAKKNSKNTEELKALVVDAILDKKGNNVLSLDLRDIKDAVADFFVIAHGDSSTQVNAIFHSIVEKTKEHGHKPYHSEGQGAGEWIIVDFVDVVAHIFYREKRDFYQLEDLWSDAVITEHTEGPAIKIKAVRPKKTVAKKAASKKVAPKKAATKKAAAPKKKK
jgi:ribosome-associated protein